MGHSGAVPAEDLDDLVQRLAVAKMALEAHDEGAAITALDAALAIARRLLTDAHDDQLVRRRPSS
jgi:pimeloyl-ACP methyl ester carboxylesterase